MTGVPPSPGAPAVVAPVPTRDRAAARATRYPLFLDLADRDVLVVGGGPVAARRAGSVVAAGARVHVIAPQLCEELHDLVLAGEVTWDPREATGPEPVQPAPDGRRWWLIHTATGDPAVDAAIAAQAEAHGVWCVRADRADGSAAHVPAVATAPDGIQVAVSGGGDPGRARAIRNAISDLLAAGRLPLRRTRIPSAAGPSATPSTSATPGTSATSSIPAAPGEPIQVSGQFASPDVDRTGEPRPELGSNRWEGLPGRSDAAGRVVLVGGGPGDPGLLTVAGRQWLARADVVVTDRLGPTSVLAELDEGVQVIDVGKTAGHHPIPQAEINDLLVEHAGLGRTVVRLKGGDPFVLGRGGEEALHCIVHGVPVEVVPGVTSAISVPAAAGIPVTHRGITTSVVVASAHAGADQALAAARSASPEATVVLLMGLSALERTADEMIRSGRAADTPAAVISSGWTPEQRTVTGTLATIAAEARAAELPGPAVIVVGEVVRLRDVLGDLAGSTAGLDTGAEELSSGHARRDLPSRDEPSAGVPARPAGLGRDTPSPDLPAASAWLARDTPDANAGSARLRRGSYSGSPV